MVRYPKTTGTRCGLQQSSSIKHIGDIHKAPYNVEIIAMKNDTKNATKTTTFTTVTKLSFKDSIKGEKSKSSENMGFRGVSGVKQQWRMPDMPEKTIQL